MVAHKTFHRYVVRAKRGTAQGARDAQGHAPKSAGATLRRYNEAALTQVQTTRPQPVHTKYILHSAPTRRQLVNTTTQHVTHLV